MERNLGVLSVLSAFLISAALALGPAAPDAAFGGNQAKKSRAGDLDKTFGTNGIGSIPFDDPPGAPHFTGGIAETSKRQIVQGIFAIEGPGAVARYTAKGKLDKSFGDDGIAGLDLKPGEANPRDIAVDAHDRIVIAGEGYPADSDDYGAAVVRLRADGKPDPAFSDDGFNLPGVLEGMTPKAIVFGHRGRIVVAGPVGGYPTSTVFVARFLPDGKLDVAFSQDGYKLIGFSPTQASTSVAVDRKNRIVVGASTQGANFYSTYAVVRIWPNGALDRTFSGDGRAVATGTDSDEGLQDITVDRKGRVLAAGIRSAHGTVVRFKANGRMDRSFGSKGRQELSWFGPSSVSVDLKGRPVLAGSEEFGGSTVVRLTPNGHESKFSGYFSGLSGLNDHYIDAKNRIVVGGYADDKVGVARLLNP